MRSIYLGPWRIDLTTRDGVPHVLAGAALARTIALALDGASAPRPASIGLVLTDDSEISALNARHLGQAGPTDVLSFPLLAPEAFPRHEGDADRSADAPMAFVLPPRARPHLGDIVVSVERALDQARSGRGGQTGDMKSSAADELRLLVTHGALHICGWDHADAVEESAMRALERTLLSPTGLRGG